jgi:hypothetical protein
MHLLALGGDLTKINKAIEEHFADPEVSHNRICAIYLPKRADFSVLALFRHCLFLGKS